MLIEVEGELVAGEVAGGQRAAHVEGLGAAGGGQRLGTLGDRGVQVQGVGQVELGLDEGGALQGDLVVVEGRRGAARPRPRRRPAAWSGMNRALATSMSRSSAAGPIRCGERRDLGVDERRGLHRDRPRVCSAMRRARQTGTSPRATRAPRRGRRYFSSRPWATSTRPESVETPSAAASSARQNSATSGAPGPARASSPSPPMLAVPGQVAAAWIDSGGWASAHSVAAARTSTSAAFAAARRDRMNPSTSPGASSSPIVRVGAVVVVMNPVNQRPLTLSSV